MGEKRASLLGFHALVDADFPFNQLTINADGSINVNLAVGIPADTGTFSSVASDSAASQELLADNPARLGGTIYNESSAVLYLLLANAAASSTQYSVPIPANSFFEIPSRYTGPINGRWAATNGNARITELT